MGYEKPMYFKAKKPQSLDMGLMGIDAAEEAAALAAAEAAAIKAAEEQAKLEEEQENEDKEPAFDPRENARMTFKFLDTNK